jgi:hypothetical protein
VVGLGIEVRLLAYMHEVGGVLRAGLLLADKDSLAVCCGHVLQRLSH